MNPIEFALRRPVTVMVLMAALVAGGGMALWRMKLYFHPGTDMAQAMAETVGYVNRAGLHAPGHRVAVHHALRHRQRARRLPRPAERNQDHRRDPGPGAQPRAGAAALRRRPARRGGAGRPEPPAGLQPL